MVLPRIWLLVAMATHVYSVYGQNKEVVCPGIKLIRLNCFKSKNPKASMPNLLFTQKTNYRHWDTHLRSVICKCAARRGKNNVFGIRNAGECRTGNLYAKEGTVPIGGCVNWKAAPCKPKMDCVGNAQTIFVYRVQPITTPKPGVTTKPTKPTTPKPTTKTKPADLMCFNYLIKIKLVKTPPGKPGTPSYKKMKCSICKTIKTIYKCYPCFRSAHFINTTTSGNETVASFVLKFGCKGKHLKQLISKLTKNAIVSAVCQDAVCPKTPLLAMSMPGCTMTTVCPAAPICSPPAPYPCATQVSAPVPVPPVTCPAGCPSSCAPNCSKLCCDQVQPNTSPLYDYSLGDIDQS